MILKSFNLNQIKNAKSNFFLLYGENEGHKDDLIQDLFLKNFKGETIKYSESQILENKDSFFEICLNESLFANEKIIVINYVTTKLYEILKEITVHEIENKIIILKAGILEKKSRLRQLFEKEKNLVCIAFYQDNHISLYKIANEFFKNQSISISSENINLILEKCSGDRKNLQNELNKILNFCLDKGKITKYEIIKLINFYDDENYFELIDQCLTKNHSKVIKIINNNYFGKNDSIILIRSFLSRLKRIIELKKLMNKVGDIDQSINMFKPPIFWKDKEKIAKQMEIWSSTKAYELLEKITKLEVKYKKNYDFSNNLIFDLILETSSKTNS